MWLMPLSSPQRENRAAKIGPYIGPYREGPIGPYGAQNKFTPMPGGLGRPSGEKYSVMFRCLEMSSNKVKKK